VNASSQFVTLALGTQFLRVGPYTLATIAPVTPRGPAGAASFTSCSHLSILPFQNYLCRFLPRRPRNHSIVLTVWG